MWQRLCRLHQELCESKMNQLPRSVHLQNRRDLEGEIIQTFGRRQEYTTPHSIFPMSSTYGSICGTRFNSFSHFPSIFATLQKPDHKNIVETTQGSENSCVFDTKTTSKQEASFVFENTWVLHHNYGARRVLPAPNAPPLVSPRRSFSSLPTFVSDCGNCWVNSSSGRHPSRSPSPLQR